MDDEASAKVAELVARLKGILKELRQLKNNDDPQSKLIAPLAALVLACIDLIEKLCEQSGCRGSELDKKVDTKNKTAHLSVG